MWINSFSFQHLPQSMASFRSIVLAINKPIIVNWTPRIDHLNVMRGRLPTNLLVIMMGVVAEALTRKRTFKNKRHQCQLIHRRIGWKPLVRFFFSDTNWWWMCLTKYNFSIKLHDMLFEIVISLLSLSFTPPISIRVVIEDFYEWQWRYNGEIELKWVCFFSRHSLHFSGEW